jgi:hypothetical protein
LLKVNAAMFARRPPAIMVGPNFQPFAFSQIEYDTERKKKRRKLLFWSLPAVFIVLLVALYFLLPTPLTSEAIQNYNHKNYPYSRIWLTPLTWASPQQFVIAFNSGTVDTQLGSYTLAQGELLRALQLATPAQRCMVLQNLVYSFDAHANLLFRQGQNQSATDLTSEVATIKQANPKCFLQPKGGGGGGGGGNKQNKPADLLTAAQEVQLQQKNQAGDQMEQQDFQQNSVNPNSPNIKPW